MGNKGCSPPTSSNPRACLGFVLFLLGIILAPHPFAHATSLGSSCTTTVLPNDGVISGNARAPNTNFRFGRAVYLITATELAASGYGSGNTPTTIGWNYQTGGAAASLPLTIYMQNTADTTNTKSIAWVNAIAGMTTVHNAMTALPSASGPFDITLTGGSSFTYTGGGLYIGFEWGEYTGTLTNNAAAWCTISLSAALLGAQNDSSAQPNMVASNFRPETRLNGFIQNDAAVTSIYSLGELPLNKAPAQIIKALITNHGASPLSNIPVSLNVTGADSFTDFQMVPSIAPCGGQAVVSFASFTPTTLGNDTVQVSVPPDEVNANNSFSRTLAVTPFNYSYKYASSTTSGGAGLNGGTGALVAKFTTTVATAITDVRLEFFATSNTTYRIAIYGDSGFDSPSTTALYVDAGDRTVTSSGPVTITLPVVVPVGPGNFYVGIQQTNTTNASLGYESETPIRTGAFFQAFSNPPPNWVDFAPGSTSKLNVGLIFQDPNATPTPTPGPTPTPSPSPTPTPSATPTPPNTLSIFGAVTYCSNPSVHAIPGVTMTLTGTASGSLLSDGSGNYAFEALPIGGSYTVTPTKAALAPGSAGINTIDVIATQRDFLNVAQLPPGCRMTAGDVNGDSAINTVDVIAVQRFFLGLTAGTGNVGKYQFSPASRAYPNVVTDQLAQNYSALIFGDVSATFVFRPESESTLAR